MNYEAGQTPIDEDEKRGLKIKSISTMGELDAFEQQNIEDAMEWLYGKSFKPEKILEVDFIQRIHYRMFKDVWKWAGQFRMSNKNIGVPFYEIRQQLQTLIDDCKFWGANKSYFPEEIAIRFKHRLVSIHLFPNGNGRHSRLMADILLSALDENQIFTWGSATLKRGEDRIAYIKALKAADNRNIEPLIRFSKQ